MPNCADTFLKMLTAALQSAFIRTIAQTPTLNSGNYKLLALAYRLATDEINYESLESSVLPMQVQATTWTLYRVIRGIDDSHTI